MLVALALTGAAHRPRVVLLTALPLVWGEGDASDVLNGRTGRSETLKRFDRTLDVHPIDTLTRATLAGSDVAIIAQPRRLTPSELVVFDHWVRDSGRAMVFADPELLWPSRYPLGDNRRAPPVTLLDPLLRHWGVTLGDSDHAQRKVQMAEFIVSVAAAGDWTGPKTCSGNGSVVLDCRIGKGRVLLVGDADMLDPRLWRDSGSDNPEWIARQIEMLAGVPASQATRFPGTAIVALAVAVSVISGLGYHKFRRT